MEVSARGISRHRRPSRPPQGDLARPNATVPWRRKQRGKIDRMPIVDRGWRLYSVTVAVNPEVDKIVYFFSRDRPGKGTPVEPPAGYRVAFGLETGAPFLEKISPGRTAPSENHDD